MPGEAHWSYKVTFGIRKVLIINTVTLQLCNPQKPAGGKVRIREI